MKQFTIIEEKWARGGKGGATALLNSDGNMCCLGFLCLERGISQEDIDGYCMPADIVRDYTNDPPPEKLVLALGNLIYEGSEGRIWDSQEVSEIASVNDDEDITDSERRDLLARIFSKLDLEPVYV